MRYFLILAALSVLLAAGAATDHAPVSPEPPAGCARSPSEGEQDGEFGGTGNAPEPCEQAPVVE